MPPTTTTTTSSSNKKKLLRTRRLSPKSSKSKSTTITTKINNNGGQQQQHQQHSRGCCKKINKKFLFVCLFIMWLIYFIGFVIMAVGVHNDSMYNNSNNNNNNSNQQQQQQQNNANSVQSTITKIKQGGGEGEATTTTTTTTGTKNNNDGMISLHHVVVQSSAASSSSSSSNNNNQTTTTTTTSSINQNKFNIIYDSLRDKSDKQSDIHYYEKFNPLKQFLDVKQKNTNNKNNNTEQQQQQQQQPKPRMKRPNWKASPFGHMVNPELFLVTDDENNKQQQQQHSDTTTTTDKRNIPENQILTAYIEEIDRYTWWDTIPLPSRQGKTAQASKLQKRIYPKLNTCSKLPEQWPVDEYPDEDPFLPWIHDVFPTHDGQFIQFVAQNKRRCHTGTTDLEEAWLYHTEPQVSLFEHVPLKKVDNIDDNNINNNQQQQQQEPRYRLSSHEDADPESIATRFICQFQPSGDITFSQFNNDYEWVAYRKGQKKMFSPDGRDNHQIQTSQLIFKCPVPESIQEIIKSGESVIDDWATIFINLIPVRTPPRTGPPDEFLIPHYKNSILKDKFWGDRIHNTFDPNKAWGTNHVLPKIKDSGRWENIPICKPSLQTYEPEILVNNNNNNNQDQSNNNVDSTITITTTTSANNKTEQQQQQYNHHLVSCLWASAGYATRGNRYAINDGQRRLIEWITFNKILGFDHFYIYDNSGAYSTEFSLQSIKDVFPGDVTIINWPSRVCNNNPNNVDSPGERSSQYAAETSCRLRFGPFVKWIGQFDIDEYLVPMGKYTSVLPLLEQLDQENKKIISFASWRAWPRRSHINEPIPIQDKGLCSRKERCFELSVPKNTTLLEAYNCDRQKPGEKKKQMPAEKQIYRADYVQQHFIHYSTVTSATNMLLEEYTKNFGKRKPFPDPMSRFVDEVNEGLMLHSKAIARQDTAGWEQNCRHNVKGFDQCRIGFPWPKGVDENEVTHTEDGWDYNCYVHDKIDDYWGPRLQEKLKELGFLSN